MKVSKTKKKKDEVGQETTCVVRSFFLDDIVDSGNSLIFSPPNSREFLSGLHRRWLAVSRPQVACSALSSLRLSPPPCFMRLCITVSSLHICCRPMRKSHSVMEGIEIENFCGRKSTPEWINTSQYELQ
jgi:hypothetical protein